MTPLPDSRFLLKPLTSLSFTSLHGARTLHCQSGRLKWRSDTKTLSIKAAIILQASDVLDSISDELTLVATAGHDSVSFILSQGFAAICEGATTTPNQSLVFHYRIEGVAGLSPNANNRA